MFFNRKKKEENKDKYNALANYKGDPMKMQFAFFGFYFIFFLIIVLLLRTGYKNNAENPKDTKTGYKNDYTLTELGDNNYHFVYKEELNNEVYIYEGDLLEKQMTFVKSGNPSHTYYANNEKFYVKDNNLLTWSESNNPINFYAFVMPYNLVRFITKGEYISYLTYVDTNEKAFNYEITNNRIREVLDLETLPNDNSTTKIVVTATENKKIKTIEMDLTNYYKLINPNINKYVITIGYSKIGKIEEIANPIN